MNIILFGTGNHYKKYRDLFGAHHIVVLLDNNRDKQNTIIDGYLVEAPENISDYEYDCIFLLASDSAGMRKQLLSYGVNDWEIYDETDAGMFGKLCVSTSYYMEQDGSRERILLLTHTLDRTGAPIVLLKAASILRQSGFQIQVVCFRDGALKGDYSNIGASVSVITCLEPCIGHLKTFIQWADIIIVNTLEFFPIIKEFKKVNDIKRVIWWLHEEDNYYSEYSIGVEDDSMLSGVEVFGVGDRVIRSFHKHFLKTDIRELLYGIEEIDDKLKKEHQGTIFAFIGSCDYRKGEDVFFYAAEILDKESNDAQYWIIGDSSRDIQARYLHRSSISFFGILTQDEMKEKYSEIDVVVCPSRNDPMPVVVTEGMMMKRVCIVSDHTGQAGIIEDKHSGLVCKSGNPEDLYQKMKWVIDNKDKWDEIGENAYLVYKKHFSMGIFEDNLMKVIDGRYEV